MARKFGTALDLAKNELLHPRLQNLSSPPPTPVTGQAYYDTTAGKVGIWNGTVWNYLGSSDATGDVTSNTASSVDGELTLFNGTTGKQIKRATGSGVVKLSNGVLGFATAGTDYAPATTGTSILKGNGSGGTTSATAGTDFLLPTGNGSGLTGLTQSQIANLSTDLAAKAPLASPTFTGTVTVPTPTNGTDATNKTYVDNAVQGLSWKNAVRVATTANITLSATQTIDGIAVAVGDRVLVKNQTTASQNGIYVVASGAWTRANDADTAAELNGATVYVTSGTAGADTAWTMTTDSITLGTTSLTFAQINGGTTPVASTTTQGKVELATTAETEAKTDTTLAVTPSGLASFARKYTGLIGDGALTSLPVTHGLGSQWVTAQVFDATTNEQIECDVVLTSATVTTFGFSVAPAANAYRVVITG